MRLLAVSASGWDAVALEAEPWEDQAMLSEKWQKCSGESRATGAAIL
jgi:hypothetical protein